MKYILTLSLIFISICCFSQNKGYVILEQDQRIEKLRQRQKDIHQADSSIDGFRIQIFMESGNDAVEMANATMEEFKEKYPDIPIYLVFGQPYYRLRVGDFRTRLEAEKVFQILSKEYKKAFITSDRIQLPYNVFCDENGDYEIEELENVVGDTLKMEYYYYEE